MGTLLEERAFGESDWVTHSNAPRLDDLSQYSLAIVLHKLRQYPVAYLLDISGRWIEGAVFRLKRVGKVNGSR